jgi:hypothetical protein
MVPGNRRDPLPIESAVLDGLGSLERLQEIWSHVRTTTATYAKDRTQQARAALLGLLRTIACELAQDVEQILPSSDYSDLWQGPIGFGMNPVEQCVDPRSSAGLRPDTRSRLEVYDDQLPRLLQIADAVLGRLAASRPLARTSPPPPLASTTSEQPEHALPVEAGLPETKKSAIRRYGSGAIAIIEEACLESGSGIGLKELAVKVGVTADYLRDNVLTPLHQGQLVDYDEVTKKWMTNTRKDTLEAVRSRKLCD